MLRNIRTQLIIQHELIKEYYLTVKDIPDKNNFWKIKEIKKELKEYYDDTEYKMEFTYTKVNKKYYELITDIFK